jgi:hypothetical protein
MIIKLHFIDKVKEASIKQNKLPRLFSEFKTQKELMYELERALEGDSNL